MRGIIHHQKIHSPKLFVILLYESLALIRHSGECRNPEIFEVLYPLVFNIFISSITNGENHRHWTPACAGETINKPSQSLSATHEAHP